MPKIAYKPGDLDADVAKGAGTLQVMTYPKGMKFAIEVELPKEVESDKLLAQELWLGVGAIYKDLVARIADNLKNTDRGAVILRNAKEAEKLKKLVDVVNRGIDGAIKIAEENGRQVGADELRQAEGEAQGLHQVQDQDRRHHHRRDGGPGDQHRAARGHGLFGRRERRPRHHRDDQVGGRHRHRGSLGGADGGAVDRHAQGADRRHQQDLGRGQGQGQRGSRRHERSDGGGVQGVPGPAAGLGQAVQEQRRHRARQARRPGGQHPRHGQEGHQADARIEQHGRRTSSRRPTRS